MGFVKSRGNYIYINVADGHFKVNGENKGGEFRGIVRGLRLRENEYNNNKRINVEILFDDPDVDDDVQYIMSGTAFVVDKYGASEVTTYGKMVAGRLAHPNNKIENGTYLLVSVWPPSEDSRATCFTCYFDPNGNQKCDFYQASEDRTEATREALGWYDAAIAKIGEFGKESESSDNSAPPPPNEAPPPGGATQMPSAYQNAPPPPDPQNYSQHKAPPSINANDYLDPNWKLEYAAGGPNERMNKSPFVHHQGAMLQDLPFPKIQEMDKWLRQYGLVKELWPILDAILGRKSQAQQNDHKAGQDGLPF